MGIGTQRDSTVYGYRMRRVVIALAIVGLSVVPGVASAKLPFFSFDVTPARPSANIRDFFRTLQKANKALRLSV